MLQIEDWYIQKHDTNVAGVNIDSWYSVQHWHGGGPVHNGQYWWTTGRLSNKGWRCAHCDEPVPDKMQGFMKLLEWEATPK